MTHRSRRSGRRRRRRSRRPGKNRARRAGRRCPASCGPARAEAPRCLAARGRAVRPTACPSSAHARPRTACPSARAADGRGARGPTPARRRPPPADPRRGCNRGCRARNESCLRARRRRRREARAEATWRPIKTSGVTPDALEGTGRARSSVRRARDPVRLREPEPSSSGTGDDEPSAGRCSSGTGARRASSRRGSRTARGANDARRRACREEARARVSPPRPRSARRGVSRFGVFSRTSADTRNPTIRFRAWECPAFRSSRHSRHSSAGKNEDAHYSNWRSRVSRYTRARC